MTFRNLLLLLLLKAALISLFILYGNVGLGPDEAQYWTWSQQPALGYYSKPPGIAWQIWLTTKLLGNNELGVRFGAVIIGTLLPIVVYFLSLACRLSAVAAFAAALGMAFCPLGVLSSFLAITDGGQVLFWALALLVLVSQRSNVILGLCIMGGALFKWPMYLFWLVALFYRVPKKGLFLGIAISLLALLPSLFWNIQNDFVTFRHVGAATGVTEGGNFISFVGSQIALLSPIFFALFFIGIWALVRKSAPSGVALCGWSSAAIIAGYTLASLFKKMQGNWCDFAYPGAMVLIAWTACDYLAARKWMWAGTLLALLLTLGALAIPTIQEKNILTLPYKVNPFRHNLGWKTLGKELQQAGYDSNQHFLFGDKYQTSSILSFYGPNQKRAYFLNLNGIRHNQFSFWPSMKQEQLGKTGYFVITENVPMPDASSYEEKLKPYFDRVESLGLKPLFFANGQLAKGAFIFKCSGYNGREAADPELY